ncbi:MAG: CoA-acylating methylmalonate-semialdehyde dehydrogenase [Acidimicrobiia bacterium]|nr:CoA-acylating methylmalonate-semialdehyde dehydrogenase [Acidimicrobiia bacterium]
MASLSPIPNFINSVWTPSAATEALDVVNPATAAVLAKVPLSPASEVDAAVQAAEAAYRTWRRVPPQERIQYLFKLRQLLLDNMDEIARTITEENGKTLGESRAEMQRALENIEVACGIPTLMQGYNLEDIAPGIDELMIRQPIGVTACIVPFNFPGMIAFWFLPYAIACGNTMIVKPSERVPLTMQKIFALLEQTGLPAGVVSLVNGGRATVDALLDHPAVKSISFVGSTAVARHIYTRGSANGKRVQCQGGAKNHVVVMPDADLEMTTKIVSDSAFGCAGQRCLAVSVAVTVGEAQGRFRDAITGMASTLKVGYGLDPGSQMGPVITPESKNRIAQCIEQGAKEGAKVVLDGRAARIPGYESGNFIGPTILDGGSVNGALAGTEIFGPVLTLAHADDLDQAIHLINSNPYGNASSIFTTSGVHARKFRYEVSTGNVGINIGVAAPMAYFPFSGWKDSFLGTLHGQGRDAIEFFTDKKVVVERWPAEWSRKF